MYTSIDCTLLGTMHVPITCCNFNSVIFKICLLLFKALNALKRKGFHMILHQGWWIEWEDGTEDGDGIVLPSFTLPITLVLPIVSRRQGEQRVFLKRPDRVKLLHWGNWGWWKLTGRIMSAGANAAAPWKNNQLYLLFHLFRGEATARIFPGDPLFPLFIMNTRSNELRARLRPFKGWIRWMKK